MTHYKPGKRRKIAIFWGGKIRSKRNKFLRPPKKNNYSPESSKNPSFKAIKTAGKQLHLGIDMPHYKLRT